MAPGPYRFSQRVDSYLQYRPRYPAPIMDLLRSECRLVPDQAIADIGSGTGILARLFLENGNRVYGVEPDPDMRAAAEHVLQGFPHFASLAGTAEATTLAHRAVDFVTAGQAFHWFDLAQARAEFRRILAPHGWVVLVWNIQRASGSPFLEALQRFWETPAFWKPGSEPSTRKMARAQAYRRDRGLSRQELLEPFFGPGMYREAVFENPLVCDLQGLMGRVLSNAPALEPEDPNYEAMLSALEHLFQSHQKDGTVTIEHDTWVVYGGLS